MDHQRLAVLCEVQRTPWPGRADFVSSQRMALHCVEQLRERYRYSGEPRPLAHSYRRYHRSQILKQAGQWQRHLENGLLADGRCGLRIRWRRELSRWKWRSKTVFPGLDALQPHLVE